jgi:hypothetical protein
MVFRTWGVKRNGKKEFIYMELVKKAAGQKGAALQAVGLREDELGAGGI